MSRTVVVIGASCGHRPGDRARVRRRRRHRARRRPARDLRAGRRPRTGSTSPTATRWPRSPRAFERVDALIVAAGTNIKERRLHELTPESLGPRDRRQPQRPVQRAARVPARAARGARDGRDHRQRLRRLHRPLRPRLPGVQGGRASRSPAAPASRSTATSASRSILPGVVDTPILDNRPEPPDARDARADAACRGRRGGVRVRRRLPPRAFVPELTILPTALQAIGKTL